MDVNIAVTINDNYAEPCAVMLSSFFKSSELHGVNVWVIQNKLGWPSKELLKTVVPQHSHIHFLHVNIDILPTVNLKGHISLETYFRLILPEIVPSNVRCLLFLDSDMIIIGKIDELFEVDLLNFEIAAAPNPVGADLHLIELSKNKQHTYFNAGVLLMNLEMMRQNESSNKLLKIATVNKTRLKFWDQDVLNLYYLNNYRNLPKIYNYVSSYFDQGLRDLGNVKILHFTGKVKPWGGHSEHPFAFKWFEYRPENRGFKFYSSVNRILLRAGKFVNRKLKR
jgi:lipopolysaccharide biosynthesis glycosyltransferase